MHRKIVITGATILALFTQLFSSSASATAFLDDPPAEAVTIDIVGVYGSGCLPGTAFVWMWPGSETFTVVYSDYLAAVGVGAKLTDFRKNCQLNMLVHVPDGYTYAIARADYSGFASLATGATGRQRASYYFQGSPNTDIRSHEFTGPFDDYWRHTDETDLAAMVFHPCGELRNLNINTELRVNVGTSDPTTTTSFIAMSEFSNYRLYWKRCP